MAKVARSVVLLLVFLAACKKSPEEDLRERLASRTTGTINLPPGVVEVSRELRVPPGAHDLDIVGSGTILKATDDFKGRAMLVVDGTRNVRLRDFTLDGNRVVLEKQLGAAPSETSLRDHFPNNGVLLDGVQGAEVSNLTLANFANLAIVVGRSSKVRMHHVRVEDSGSLDSQGHSNGSGGVAFEDGSTDFEVRSSTFHRLRGNALWTRSATGAPRQQNGLFAANRFDAIGRDAILIWHASRMRVEENTGARIGYPNEAVDPLAQPAAIGTFGNVDHSTYAKNQFEEVNGKCIDLDGFHDGIVMRNQCADRRLPDEYPFGHFGIVMNNSDPAGQPANIEITGNVIDGMKYGGLFLIGSGHRVMGNRFEHLNKAKCGGGKENRGCLHAKDEPKMFESGIYLGRGGAHRAVARANLIRDNTISGYKMETHCIVAAPGVSLQANTLGANTCSDFEMAH
ncbi:MAG: right-handed parallel beta-helix repeat-containing protein [Acidobacteriia bacterium]|nr:right-handed parallel beta-helix repeat-containing protein [Terriglobia bacterium]